MLTSFLGGDVRPSVPRLQGGLSTAAVPTTQSGGIPIRAVAAIESFLNRHAEGPDSGCSEPVFVCGLGSAPSSLIAVRLELSSAHDVARPRGL
eukprot:1936662-Prymnesium_polylepis.1